MHWQGSCLLRMWGESAPGQPTDASLVLSITVSRHL